MKIRTAVVADLDHVCALADEIAALHSANEPEVFMQADRQRDRAFWLSSIEQVDGTVLVAAKEATILGFVTAKAPSAVGATFLRQRSVCRIGTIVVSHQAQREGIGSKLIHAIEAWATARSATEIRLEVFSFNEQASSFYAKLGYGVQSHNMHKCLVPT